MIVLCKHFTGYVSHFNSWIRLILCRTTVHANYCVCCNHDCFSTLHCASSQLTVHLYLDWFLTHFSDIADAVDDFTADLLIIVSSILACSSHDTIDQLIFQTSNTEISNYQVNWQKELGFFFFLASQFYNFSLPFIEPQQSSLFGLQWCDKHPRVHPEVRYFK